MAANAVLAPFNRLPVEILLQIALLAPDLPALYALDTASTRFALVFDQYGTRILERVLDTAGLGAPPEQLREIIRLVVHVRTMCLNNKPPQTPAVLDAFMSQLFERNPNSAAFTPIPRDTPPSLLRDLLATATTIAQLAPLCLAAHMRRCLDLRPSHPIDKSKPGPVGWMEPRPPYFTRPGYTYTPHNSGPPSWLETERVLRAFWTVQLYLDLCRGIADGRIVFAEDGDGVLRELDVTIMGGCPLISTKRPVAMVVEWLCEDLGWELPDCKVGHLEQDRKDTPLHLPCPPKQGVERDFDWENEGKGWFPGCEEEFVFQHDKLNCHSLDESPGETFLDSTMGNLQRVSPVFNIRDLPIFRRLGIAFWDSRRLMGFELLGPLEEDGFDPQRVKTTAYFSKLELMYTWISIADAAGQV